MFYKGEIPFVRLLIPLISGILLGMHWPWQTFPDWLLMAGGLSILIFLMLVLLYTRLDLFKTNWLPGVTVQVVILCAGTILTLHSAERYNPSHFARFTSEALIVTASNEPLISGKTLRFEANVEQSITSGQSIPVSGKLLVSLRSSHQQNPGIKYGSRLLIRSSYHEVDPPYNPAEFNVKAYLESKQIYHQTFINHYDLKILSQENNSKVVTYALQLRQRLVTKFYRYLDNSDAAALASTLILGYRASLSKEIISAYSKTGTLHVLSVSGMHVGIVFIVLNFVFMPLRRIPRLKYFIVFVVAGAIWSYALITGFSPSVCRAAAMMTIVVLGKALNRDLNSYNLLAISAFVLLIYNPFYLVDIGFQLSYLAVFGLIYLQPKIYQSISIKNKLLDYAWKYAALSLAAQLATFPVSLYYFHQFPVYFLLSNLLVVIPVALIMYLGLLLLFVPWPPVLNIIGDLLNRLILITNRGLFVIEELPFSTINGVWISTSEYLLIDLIIISIILAKLTKRKLAIYAGLSASILLSASIAVNKIGLSSQEDLIFYSLRQRSAVGYMAHSKAYLVTDMPAAESAYSFSLIPALESRGVTQIIPVSPNRSFSDRNQRIRIAPNVLQFGDYRVLRWNDKMNGLTFSRIINADAVLLSGNPKVTVSQLMRYTNFSILLIDASNAGYNIKKWRAEAEKLKIDFRILKGSPAYVIHH